MLNVLINRTPHAKPRVLALWREYAEDMHSKCPDINCPCQHVIGVTLRSDTERGEFNSPPAE